MGWGEPNIPVEDADAEVGRLRAALKAERARGDAYLEEIKKLEGEVKRLSAPGGVGWPE